MLSGTDTVDPQPIENVNSAGSPAVIASAQPTVSSPTNLLPPGYQMGPNSASDPVFQQAYAQWMASTMQASVALTQLPSTATVPASSPGVFASVGSWFTYEYNTWAAVVSNPGAALGGAWDGAVDGAAMVANAATFHQIDTLDNYVDQAIAQNGGVYGTANVFGHIGAYAGEAAILVYAWTAAGLPTYSVAVNTTEGTHVVYGVTQNGVTAWQHYVTGVGVTGAPTFYAAEAGYWGTLSGVPILFPEAALASAAGGNCVTAAMYAYAQGMVGGLVVPATWPPLP